MPGKVYACQRGGLIRIMFSQNESRKFKKNNHFMFRKTWECDSVTIIIDEIYLPERLGTKTWHVFPLTRACCLLIWFCWAGIGYVQNMVMCNTISANKSTNSPENLAREMQVWFCLGYNGVWRMPSLKQCVWMHFHWSASQTKPASVVCWQSLTPEQYSAAWCTKYSD